MTTPTPCEQKMSDCVNALRQLKASDSYRGALRLDAACRVCVERGMSDEEAVKCIEAYAEERPFPGGIDSDRIRRRLRAARGLPGAPGSPAADPAEPSYRSVGELMLQFPNLRPPLIHGLLRMGETMNVIASPKTGKSWLVTDLALSVATSRLWLGTYKTEPGKVLIIDNELHGETLANRIPKVAAARGIDIGEIAEEVFVENLRGRLRDLRAMGPYFQMIEPGRFKLIVMDAFYRFIPRDTDENDNASIAQLYNYLDNYALDLGCSFVLIHHSTKGNQSGKAITDVGAGAGSQSRATDTHLILRPHQEQDAVVLDAAVRSWPKVDPICLKWSFPVWNPAYDLDPSALKSERGGRRQARESREPAKAAEPIWDATRFVQQFVRQDAQIAAAIIEAAQRAGLSERKAEKLLRRAEDMHLAYRWQFASNEPVKYATVQQPLIDVPVSGKKKSKRQK